MSDLRELYQETVLEHAKNPRNHHALEAPCSHAHGHNPLCGDQIEVFVRLEGERIAEVSFLGKGCAISQASASLMTQALKGRTLAEAEHLGDQMLHLLTEEGAATPELGKLVVFQGVREFPLRVKCATLAWHTLRAALGESEQTVSTE